MGGDTTVDLYSVQFWWIVAAAMGIVVPLTAPRARSWALAAINLGFLALLLKRDVAVVLVLIAGVWVGLKGMARLGVMALPFAGATLALFLAYKLAGPALAESSPLFHPLTVIGYSYVALRLVDVARAVAERRHPPPDLASTVNYLVPFHMLAAGPIQPYDEFAAQPAVPPPPTMREAVGALDRIASGLVKKYILANFLQAVFLTGFHARGVYLLIEAPLTFLWLYLDFTAYSEVAVGVGRLIGVATPENFDRPLAARNVIEFWDRWHISLSQFIRRNVFIPIQMGLMRRTGGRHMLAIASAAFTISFLLCGLWHGVGWPWIGWGVVQAGGLIGCNLYKHWLLGRLGRKGVNRYLENPYIRAGGVTLTYLHQSLALVVATFPYQELSTWTSNSP